MSTAGQDAVQELARYLEVIHRAAAALLARLNVHVAEVSDLHQFLDGLEQARLSLGGWGRVARRLNMSDAELSELTLRLRLLRQTVAGREQEASDNQRIAALRLLVILEQVSGLTFTSLPGDAAAIRYQARQQMRTLTLMLEALVTRAWPDVTRFHNYLKLHFGPDRVRRWLSKSEGEGIISGMRFSELALLVVDKKLFARHYARLFNSAAALTLLVEQRATLHAFLESCRPLRNAILAGRPLSAAEGRLLDLYFQQIAGPVQRACREGRTGVDPQALGRADDAALAAWWARAVRRAESLGEDTLPVGESIDPSRQGEQRTPQARDRLMARGLWGLVGAVALAIIGGGAWLIGASATPEQAPTAAAPVSSAGAAPERPSARETLSRRGVSWDANALRAAIDRNDVGIVRLFLQGGMTWRLAWTEQALAAGSDEVLGLLLRYRLQMDEPKPCRRFINTLSHAMASGAALTAMRKTYLQTFCTTEPVVQRQRYSLDQARQRAAAAPNDENKKWLTIQSAIYEEIE